MQLSPEIQDALRKSNPDLLNQVEAALTQSQTMNPEVKELSPAEQAQLKNIHAQMSATDTTAAGRGRLAAMALKLRGLDNLFPKKSKTH